MLTKFRKSFILLLFSVILLNFCREEKEEEDDEDDLNFRIVGERGESIGRLDIERFVSVNELFTFNAMVLIRFTDSDVRSLLNSFLKENEKVSSLIIWVIIFINVIIEEV